MFAILGSITIGKPYIYPYSKVQANFKQETAYDGAETRETALGMPITSWRSETRR